MFSVVILGLGSMGMKKGINRDRRRKEEEFIKCDRCSMWVISTIGEAASSYCCRKCEEIAQLRMVITRL